MARLSNLLPCAYARPAGDPIERTTPWPSAIVVGLILAGTITPLICFAGAVLAYALADRDQGTILTGAGLAHVVLGLTLLAGV